MINLWIKIESKSQSQLWIKIGGILSSQMRQNLPFSGWANNVYKASIGMFSHLIAFPRSISRSHQLPPFLNHTFMLAF